MTRHAAASNTLSRVDLTSLLFGFSKALYANWLVYKPDHLLVDCGEGAATQLGNSNYGVERVLLTHGHIDHIAGLPSLLWSRAAGMGDREKPLALYHPSGDEYLADMRAYLEKTARRLTYELTWLPLQAGDEFALPSGRTVRTWATRHMKDAGGWKLTLGYKVVETRRRLRPQSAHLSEAALRDLSAHEGRDAVRALMEDYDATLAAFGGDGFALNPDDVRGADLLVHEATLLDARERGDQAHSTLDEAVEVAVRAGVGCLLLNHVSGRYARDEVGRAGVESAARHGATFPIWCLHRHRLILLAGDSR